MRLPYSDKATDWTPARDVFEDQITVLPSKRTRFPVLSSSTIALLVTGEFLYDDH